MANAKRLRSKTAARFGVKSRDRRNLAAAWRRGGLADAMIGAFNSVAILIVVIF